MEVNPVKREEKNSLTRQQILESALREFGSRSYAEASLNTISREGNLSKGIIYHYFKDKDDLYLSCVSLCIKGLVTFLEEKESLTGRPLEDVTSYLRLRHQYFERNPDCRHLFTTVLTQPPRHLVEEIAMVRKELDDYNKRFFQDILKGLTLRDGVSQEEAMEFFLMFQEAFNQYFTQNIQGEKQALFALHEEKLTKFLPLLFHGIAKE